MNKTHKTVPSFFNDAPRSKPARSEIPARLTVGLTSPDDVVDSLWLTPAAKREILASWASDARSVPDAPALRQLDNGAIVRVDDVLRALQSLDDGGSTRRKRFGLVRPFAGSRFGVPIRLKSASRPGRPDDDDDPPPCPATIARLPGGPRSDGEAADLRFALAA